MCVEGKRDKERVCVKRECVCREIERARVSRDGKRDRESVCRERERETEIDRENVGR